MPSLNDPAVEGTNQQTLNVSETGPRSDDKLWRGGYGAFSTGFIYVYHHHCCRAFDSCVEGQEVIPRSGQTTDVNTGRLGVQCGTSHPWKTQQQAGPVAV